MLDLPYVEAHEKMESFFEAVRKAVIPEKFTYRFFADIGFPSSNDRDFVKALRQLGFINAKGRPTKDYQGLKDADARTSVLSEKLRVTYEDMFEELKLPQNVPENVLNGYFGRITGESMEKVLVYAKTFKAIAKLAEFDDSVEDGQEGKKEKRRQKKRTNINLNLSLPTTTDEKVYQVLFKHLKDLVDS